MCRAFTPPPGSRAFNTSRVFRCVDIALADTEQGIVVSRLMEWAAPAPKVCDWTAAREALAMEVDFVRGDVCVGGLCMPVDRLSTIGKLRLRELIESALRELGLLASTSSVRARLAFPASRPCAAAPAEVGLRRLHETPSGAD